MASRDNALAVQREADYQVTVGIVAGAGQVVSHFVHLSGLWFPSYAYRIVKQGVRIE